MKNYIIPSVSVICLLYFLSSCGPREMEMKNINYENEFYLSQQDTSLGALTIGINVDIPTKYYNNEILENIRKQIIAKIFTESYTGMPIDSIIPSYVRKLVQTYHEDYDDDFIALAIKNGGPVMSNEVQIEGTAMFSDDKFLSYSYERYAYMGGAHGNSNRFFFNFDLSNAGTINEKDIFIDGYDESLTSLLKESIMEMNAEEGDIHNLEEINYWEDQIKPNNNFYLSEDGLVYVFNAYEIAPYSVGQTEVTLPFSKLKPILRPENKIAYLYSTERKTNKKKQAAV